MDVLALIAAVFSGSFFGSFLGPLMLDEWKSYRRRNSWEKPRKQLIQELFSEVPAPVISLRDIAVRAGASHEETRDLLVSLGASGTTMSNGEEGWCLDKGRWFFSSVNIDRQKS